MKMKYFQGIADIKNHYDDILRQFGNEKYGHGLLETWNIGLDEKEDILEEREMLRYLVGCETMIVHEENAKKPTIEIVNRCFHRHLEFLKEIFYIYEQNVNQYNDKLIQREYKTCRHYLFQFSLPAWYEKLPDEILTFQNKYKDIEL